MIQVQSATVTTTSSKAAEKQSRPKASADLTASLRQLLKTNGASEGAVAIAKLDGTQPLEINRLDRPFAWSSIKTVILATLISDLGGPSRLSSSQKAAATLAITASDNDAAMSLFHSLEDRHGGISGAAKQMQNLLRKAGDSKTVVSTKGRDGFSPYGQTLWTPAAQVTFLASLARGCLIGTAGRDYLLGLMNNVVADQRWGLGTVGASAFKGGWGPDPSGGYLVRQIGLITPSQGGGQVAVAIAARPSNGAFSSGSAELGSIASWVKRNSPPGSSPKACASPN